MLRLFALGVSLLLSFASSTRGAEKKPVHRVEVIEKPLRFWDFGGRRSDHFSAIHPQGTKFTEASLTGNARIWDIETGKLLRRFSLKGGGITGITHSWDASTLAVVRYTAGTIDIWDVNEGKRSRVFEYPKKKLDFYSSMCFNRDGTKFFIGDWNGDVVEGDVSEGSLVQFANGPKSPLFSLMLSPDDRWLFSSDKDKIAELFDLASMPPKKYLLSERPLFEDEDVSFTTAAFTPDSRTLYMVVNREHLIHYNLANHAIYKLDNSPKGCSIRALAVSPQGQYLAIAGQPRDHTGHRIRLLDRQTREELVRYNHEHADVDSLAFTPDGRLLVSSDEGGNVRVWPVPTGRPLSFRPVLPPNMTRIHQLHFGDAGRLLLASTRTGKVCLWDVAASKRLATLDAHAGAIWAFAIAPNRKLFATAGHDRLVRVWTLEDEPKLVHQFTHSHIVTSLAFSPDEFALAVGDNKGQLHLWDSFRRKIYVSLPANQGPVYALRFHPDGRWLVSGGSDGSVRLWDIARTKKVHTLALGKAPVLSFAFLDEGNRLAIGTGDGRLALWDVRERKLLDEIARLGLELRSLAVTHDNRLLASTSMNFIAIVEREGPAKLLQPRRHRTTSRSLRTLSVAPDGYTLATADSNGLLELRTIRRK